MCRGIRIQHAVGASDFAFIRGLVQQRPVAADITGKKDRCIRGLRGARIPLGESTFIKLQAGAGEI